MQISNVKLVKILKDVAAAYTLKNIGNIFQIRAYENAASSIEHSTVELYDLWQEGRLGEVPSLGNKLQEHLTELFQTGKVGHFEEVKKGIEPIVFELLDIPGVGPKTAKKLAVMGVKNLEDLRDKITSGKLVEKGFSSKLSQKILLSLSHEKNVHRMLLPYAFAHAEKVINYLLASEDVLQAHPLGSLRRQVATIGDLDFAVSSFNPQKVVEYFCKMPGVARIVDKGDNQASVILGSDLRLDLLVGHPDAFGALLQHFTGSKAHNIHLRKYAQDKGYSLNKYGIRKFKIQNSKLITTKTEEELYKKLGMQAPPPEIREDAGEIEKALINNLPQLVQVQDIKGDIHLHSNYPLASPSHAPGVDSIEDIAEKGKILGYCYVGIADHPPGFLMISKEEIVNWVQKRTKFIQNLNMKTKSIRVLNGLEIDILSDGSLSVPDEALELLDYCIAGIHSGHSGTKDKITQRLISALENPQVDIISHPTNRLLGERESSEADWEAVFRCASTNKKILEINAYPNRLDLRDDLVRMALGFGVKFVINTDAHALGHMDNMRFGVAVAKRGWATKADVINTLDWTDLKKWFKL